MVYLLAYSLIRLLMAQAAPHVCVHARVRLSFEHTVQVWTAWLLLGLAGAATARNDVLFSK